MLSSPEYLNFAILHPPFIMFLFAPVFLLTIATFRRIKGATAMRAYSEIHFCFLLSVCFSMQVERRTFPPAFLFPPAAPFYLRVADREKENISCYSALVIEPYLFTRPSTLIRDQHFRGRFRLFGGGASAASSLRTYLKHI